MVGPTAAPGGLLLWRLWLLSRRHGPFQVPSQQRVEWFTELGLKADVAESFIILDHQHLREERLIDHSLDVLRSISIRSSAVNRQIQRQLQIAFDAFVLKARCFELRSDLLQGTTNALLLAPEKIERNRSGVVGLQEFLALTLEFLLLTLEVRLFGLHLLATRAELLTDHRLDAQAEARIKLHPVVVVLELLLDFVDQDRSEIADGALGVTARAVVVGVLHAGRRSGVLDHESLTALTAVDGALQEVWMLADAFAVDVRGEYILDQLPGLIINWKDPPDLHSKLGNQSVGQVTMTLNAAYDNNAIRFRRLAPSAPSIPELVSINPPELEVTANN